MEENIVIEWENIVSSLDFCEKPEDLARILLFPAFSLCARFRDLLVEFFCERITINLLVSRLYKKGNTTTHKQGTKNIYL